MRRVKRVLLGLKVESDMVGDRGTSVRYRKWFLIESTDIGKTYRARLGNVVHDIRPLK